MNSKNTMVRLAATGMIAFALSLGACGDIERGETTPPAKGTDNGGPNPTTDGTSNPTTDGTVAGLSFEVAVQPILMEKCSGCHTATHGSAFRLTGDPAADYTVASALIDKGSPDASKILVKGSGTAHGGGAVLKADSPEFATVKEWITGGALP